MQTVIKLAYSAANLLDRGDHVGEAQAVRDLIAFKLQTPIAVDEAAHIDSAPGVTPSVLRYVPETTFGVTPSGMRAMTMGDRTVAELIRDGYIDPPPEEEIFASVLTAARELLELRRLRAEAGIVLPVTVDAHNEINDSNRDDGFQVGHASYYSAEQARYIAALLNAAPKLLGEEK